ncbi:hypothetical protein N7452_009085 [Penicillium brevicompactum]|uniref:Major facilitator superfamily (MFS) profile domain-containing protein n=1 Tax=Penicillium brevicompactum TaxID=5074 RepID=A0A9W9Q807_PENBR|nr:hypothetical protein N7452_009085 [Penicillium brevicompactum]
MSTNERLPARVSSEAERAHSEKQDESTGVMENTTLVDNRAIFERKAALVNAEIDKFGFGKYQWCIWMLCGLGYFVDLAWAQGVGLMATAVFQEMGVPADKQGLIYTCSNAGLAIGAFGFGVITDIIGRKWAFQITSLGRMQIQLRCNLWGLLLVFNWARGNVPIDATIALEFLPQNRRYLVALLGMWQPIGVVVASAIAYATAARYRCDVNLPSCSAVKPGEACCTVSSNMGWRYMVIIIGAMTLTIFCTRYLIFRFHESPKFLVSKGREQDAIDVLHKIAKFNGAEPPTLTIEDFRQVDRAASVNTTEPVTEPSAKGFVVGMFKSLSFLHGLFTDKLQCFSFVLLGVAYMGNYWSFNLAGYFLPIVLLNNNVDSGANNVTETYREKWSLVISAALQGVSMAMYTQVESTAGYVGLNALEYIMQSYFNAVLYSASPEMFDTTYRASASGMLSCLGRIAGIVAPFAGQKFIAEGRAGVLWLGAGGIWVSAILMCFLPIEMRNKQMY